MRGTTIPKAKIAVLPGDGIGPEVTNEAVKVLEATGLDFEFVECLVGGAAYIENGDPLPQEARDVIDESSAVLFGAVGHDYAPYGVPRKVLAYLRVEKDAYANVRPLKLYPGISGPSPTQGEVDVVIIRDNSEGTALEHEGYLWEDKGLDKRVITSFGARRISSFAFDYAAQNGRKKVTCVDLSGWLYGDQLFRRSFLTVAKLMHRVEADCVSVDIAAMIQARDPMAFDLIVTPDMYGDILSGIVIGQIGGVGMAPSACIGDDFAFFEPVHGTAWDIAGRGVANPIASILSAKLMLEWLGFGGEARAVEDAVCHVLSEGEVRTADIGGSSSTSEVGDAVASYVSDGPVVDGASAKLVEAEG